MPESVEQTTHAATDQPAPQVAPTVHPEVARQMEIAMNGGFIPAEKKEDAPPVVQDIVQPPADIFQPFKEKFGYNNPEDALAEIEQLRAFKNNPQPPTIEFENEDSEKLFKAFVAGKKDEVYRYLDKSVKIENYLSKEVNESTAPDLVKFAMQLKYKSLTPSQIDHKFNKQFAIPPKPIEAADEDPLKYQERLSLWEADANDRKIDLMIEAQESIPVIQAQKPNFVVPDIDQPVDQAYVQYKKMLEDEAKWSVEAKEAYKTFTPKSIETKLNFKDEANKIDFDFQYEPDAESFAKTVPMATEMNAFWGNFINQDGSPNRVKFLDALYFALNKDKVILEAIKQGKNAAIKAMLPDNSSGGIVRQITTMQPTEETELEKNMRLHGLTKLK